MEVFLAAQALYGADNSDSDSVRSDLSETYGTVSYPRRPGTGRRKKQTPWRSPWDASVNTDYAPEYLATEYLPSRLGHATGPRPLSPGIPAPADDPAPVSTPNCATPGFKSKKAKQDLSGPCCHCNATNSPQWRKGPKGKPVLCNACGIRFLRTRTLGKAMPKKRRVTAATGGGDHLTNTQSKHIKTDEDSTEEEGPELHTEDMLVIDDANAAADNSLQHANSGSINHSSVDFTGFTAVAAAVGHHVDQSYQDAAAAAMLPISRLAVVNSDAGSLQDDPGCTETEDYGPCGQLYEQQYPDQHYSSSNAVDQNAVAVAAALLPQFQWPVISISPSGPSAAAAAAAAAPCGNASTRQTSQSAAMRLAAATAAARTAVRTSSSSSELGCHSFLPVTTLAGGLQQPLAAGSRLLLNAGGNSRVSHTPALTAALALQQQQQQRNCSSDQQQPQSPLAYGIYNSSAAVGSPLSHKTALHSHLKAEFSGLSCGTGSAPASPLAVAAASSCPQHVALSSNSSGGIYSALSRQQQQHGLHGPSPLSVMAATADVAVAADQHALSAAATGHTAPAAAAAAAAGIQQHAGFLVPYQSATSGQAEATGYSAAAAAAAPGSTAAVEGTVTGSSPDVMQLMRLVADALGGMGNTWEILKSLNSNNSSTAAAGGAAAASDLVCLTNTPTSLHQQQQQQQQYL